mgnify:CR=1 FL=1
MIGRMLSAALAAFLALPAAAQDAPPGDPAPQLAAAARQVALAHVLTGDPEVDEAARQGLDGLSLELTLRTTVEPGPPLGIDVDQDDLSLLTFLAGWLVYRRHQAIRDRLAAFEARSPNICLRNSQSAIAKWQAEHPEWQVTRWRCAVRGSQPRDL